MSEPEKKRITLKESGAYVLMDDVNSSTVKPIIEWILEENSQDNPIEFLTLMINSHGGSGTDAFALIDVMKGSKIPVRTVGLGIIASCGIMIFMSGQKGHRILTPNTSILSHTYSWGSNGKEHELYAKTKEFDLTSKRMMYHYKKCTGLTEKVIREKLLKASDTWLTAEEAKKLGICDQIKYVY